MAEYTWDDIIINPTSDRAKKAIGKECYVSQIPTCCLEHANENDFIFLAKLNDINLNLESPFIVYFDDGKHSASCIIVKKEEPYSERAKKWIEENNLKVGDYVKVLRKTEPHENRWGSFWVDEMSDHIGKALKVLGINSVDGLIILECDDTAYDFPYFVLEKVEPLKPKYVPFKSVEEFLDGYYKSETERVKDGLEHYLSTRGIWIRYKITGFLYQITMLGTTTVIVNTDQLTDFKELLEKYEFLDSTPCGKLMEESNA